MNQTPNKSARARGRKGKSPDGVRSVDRALQILEAYSPQTPSMSVLEIQKKIGLNRPTVYRLLETLAAHGFIRIHGTPTRYSLDYAVARLAQNWSASLDPVSLGRSIVQRLHDQTKETVVLAMLRGYQYFYVMELKSPHVISMSRGIGPMGHLTRGAGGKAILAFMPEKDRDAVLRSAAKDLDKRALLRDLAFVQANRFWVARGEILKGAVGIGSPYFDVTGRVLGAIVVFGPRDRFDEQRIISISHQVVEGAEQLSKALGYAASQDSESRVRVRPRS